jgi:hypothetical protein
MNKKALVFLVIVISLLLPGCELLGIVEISIRNNSTETILYLFSSVGGGEMRLDPEWERDDMTIPVGSFRRVFFPSYQVRMMRVESANMYWDYSYTTGYSGRGDTFYWFLTDANSSPL